MASGNYENAKMTLLSSMISITGLRRIPLQSMLQSMQVKYFPMQDSLIVLEKPSQVQPHQIRIKFSLVTTTAKLLSILHQLTKLNTVKLLQ